MTHARSECPQLVGPSAFLANRLESAIGLTIGFDYDGTLAPIRADPDAPTVPVSLRKTVQSLANQDNVRVAIVSGRALSDLTERLELSNVLYAGNHGLELSADGERTLPQGFDDHQETVQSVCQSLETALVGIPGCRIENKGITLTVHVRETPAEHVDRVREIVQKVATEEPDVRMTTGKQVFEIRPAVDHDKGTTMQQLARKTSADWLTLYLGDDTTDEAAFEAVEPEGIGIHVGTNRETAASYRVPSQQAVPALVNWIAETFDTFSGTEQFPSH